MLRRYHKLRVLLGGFWHKENRPPSERLFRPYKDLPEEARDFLVKCAAAHSAAQPGRTLDSKYSTLQHGARLACMIA